MKRWRSTTLLLVAVGAGMAGLEVEIGTLHDLKLGVMWAIFLSAAMIVGAIEDGRDE